MKKWNPMRILKQKSKQDFTLENGALILERLITDFNGDSLPFRIYSHQELIVATDGFNEIRSFEDSFWILYEGNHEDRIILVKTFPNRWKDQAITEIVVASQMSKHKNILMFIGCCIETEVPILVFEHCENGNYGSRYLRGDDIQSLQLDSRLRIAIEVATALTFFHQGTSRTVIHGDVTPKNVFLDECNRAKLADFGLSKLIPIGKDHFEGPVAGTVGFIAPESLSQGLYTEKSDVYSFGATLLQIITGKDTLTLSQWASREGHRLYDILHGKSTEDIYLSINDPEGGNEEQLKECARLTRRCLQEDPDRRPCMLEVAKSLSSIRKFHFQDLSG